jgi:3-hydroxyisobutyrate dehydrogenase-like beta-hydroxyacid dehydrogenase
VRVGFIGLGEQGAPVARAIANAGFDLYVWARRAQSLEAVREVAYTKCDSVAELATHSELVGLCVRDDSDVEDVLFGNGLLANMKPESIVVNHGTGSPEACIKWAQRGREISVAVLDAPVSGGPVEAEQSALTMMVGGDKSAFMRSESVFRAFSRTIVYLGPAGSGQLAKLMNNVVMASNLKNWEDIIALADAFGVNLSELINVLKVSSANFGIEMLTKYITSGIAEHSTEIIGKDVSQFADTARAHGIPESPLEGRARQGVDGIVAAVRRLSELELQSCQGEDDV